MGINPIIGKAFGFFLVGVKPTDLEPAATS